MYIITMESVVPEEISIVVQIIGMWILNLYSNYVSKAARILCRCRSLIFAQHFIVQVGKESDLLFRESQQQSIIQHIDINININIKEISWNGRLWKCWWCRGRCGAETTYESGSVLLTLDASHKSLALTWNTRRHNGHRRSSLTCK